MAPKACPQKTMVAFHMALTLPSGFCRQAGDEDTVASGPTHQRMAADIWSVVDLLRGDYRRAEYGHVILPFTVLRRLDAVLGLQDGQRTLQLPFCNTSGLDFTA